MNQEFDTELLKEDARAVRDSFVSFVKSFGPSPKKYPFATELEIKYNMWVVETGPIRIFKRMMTFVVAAILFVYVFVHADILFKFVTVFIFIMFYAWFWQDELAQEKKDGKGKPDQAFAMISGAVTGAFAKKEEKKK